MYEHCIVRKLTVPDGVLLQQVHHVDVGDPAALLHQRVAVGHFATTGATEHEDDRDLWRVEFDFAGVVHRGAGVDRTAPTERRRGNDGRTGVAASSAAFPV